MWDKRWDAALFAKWEKTWDMLMGQNRGRQNQRNHGIKGGICLVGRNVGHYNYLFCVIKRGIDEDQ